MKRFTIRSLFVLATLVAVTVATQAYRSRWAPLDWQPYSTQRVEELLKNHRTVLVSLTANWDISSQMHELNALNTPEMFKFVRDYEAVALRADFTNGDPNVAKLMKELGIKSVPAFIVYSPTEGKPPKVLEGITHESVLRQEIAYARYRPGPRSSIKK